MKNSLLSCLLLIITFMWAPPDSGNPPIGYVVEVSDKLGQIVETATVTTNTYSTDYEGTLLISVSALDGLGGYSSPSDWSDCQISEMESKYLIEHASKLNTSLIIYFYSYVQTFYKLWEDPYEVD